MNTIQNIVLELPQSQNREFLRSMRDMVSTYKPDVIASLEPRISKEVADSICKRLGKKELIRIEAIDFRGDIWVLWNSDKVGIKVLRVRKHLIHLMIAVRINGTWYLTIVYASPCPHFRRSLWSEPDKIGAKSPSLIIRDFNVVMNEMERSSGVDTTNDFVDCVHGRGLIDMSFVGPKFTWNHGNSLQTRKSAGLDKGLYDDDWRCKFPETTVQYIPHSYSDHRPLLVQVYGLGPLKLGGRSFRFQAAWFSHKAFIPFARSN